jgi:hypothetical protein
VDPEQKAETCDQSPFLPSAVSFCISNWSHDMRRISTFTVLAALAVAGRASAIEMFTNFNNGQNIGFPPLEVPTRIYGGFGRGGWNPHAEGMPLKTNPPVPAMMPTGQIPGGRTFDYYGRPPGVMIGNGGTASQRELVSDRRRARWQRGSLSASNSDGSPTSRRTTTADTVANETSRSAAAPPPTILRAQSEDLSNGAVPLGNSTSGEGFQDWPKADALFPH